LLDTTDKAIIDIIKNNSRIQWREIGEMVHLTGQAVGNRIRRMEELGLIKGYTVDLDYSKLGQPLTAFVTVFMKSTNHMGFKSFSPKKQLSSEPTESAAMVVTYWNSGWLPMRN
jgi:Lrp/AsnC family transcriptional regulator, leucine-responsive regulatory protein